MDGSIGQMRSDVCTFVSIAKLPEYFMIIILNNNFLNKYKEEGNRESDCLDYVFYLLSRSFLLSDSQFFSNGVSQIENFGIVRNEGVNNKSLLKDVIDAGKNNIPNPILNAIFCQIFFKENYRNALLNKILQQNLSYIIQWKANY